MFVISLAVCAYAYLIVWGRPPSQAVGRIAGLGTNLLLLTLFAAHHSILARDRPKIWLGRFVPAHLLRSVYVWTASLLLIGVCLLWRRVGGELYDAGGGWAVMPAAIQLLGVSIIARAVAGIDSLELAGIRPASAPVGLQTGGPYRWVRHPLYSGWVLAVFGTPHLTGDRLAFAVMTTAYLAIAVPWEERSLRRTFGQDYARYVREVKWRIVPFIY
jgi:methanethiol S-methyltransferase